MASDAADTPKTRVSPELAALAAAHATPEASQKAAEGSPKFGSPEWLEQRNRQLEEQEALREAATVHQLGWWQDEQRALPTDFIACALFSAVQGRDKTYFRGEQIACINGYTVTFTGKRLTQVHADVLMGAAHLARSHNEGHIVQFRARQFLRLIGRHTGKSQRKSLQQLIDDVIATSVRVTAPDGKTSFSGSLLTRAADVEDGDDAVFAVEISRELCKAFTNGFAKVNFEQRKALMKQPLALWLQLYMSKFHKPQAVSELRRLSGSTTRRLTDFRKHLRVALDVLVSAGAISAWNIDAETDVLFYAQPGKALPGGRSSHAKSPTAPVAAPAAQTELALPMPSRVSSRVEAIFLQRFPGHDFVRCHADWQKWVMEKRIPLKNPDGHFLDFATKWAK